MITHLPFDSSLFGYPVGKFLADEFWKEDAFIEMSKDFHLVYIFSKKPITRKSDLIREVDIRLTFEKQLKKATSEDPKINHNTDELSDQLLSLALESGVYSRFKTDPNFKNEEFQKLYRLWVLKALENGEVLIAEDYAGFITSQVKEDTAQIGLIAVDENHRGKGVAKRLLQASENYSWEKGAKTITVATQEANLTASNLYQKFGYTLKEKVFVYHYWRASNS